MNEPSILQVVLMGMIVVFIALICLIGIIKLMGLIMQKQSERKASAAAAPAAAPAAPTWTPGLNAAPARGGNQQLVAAIAAAIAEELGEDVNHIKIHSIRRL